MTIGQFSHAVHDRTLVTVPTLSYYTKGTLYLGTSSHLDMSLVEERYSRVCRQERVREEGGVYQGGVPTRRYLQGHIGYIQGHMAIYRVI